MKNIYDELTKRIVNILEQTNEKKIMTIHDRNEEKIKTLDLKNNILVLGLNPSSSDEYDNEDGILHYIPHLLKEQEKDYFKIKKNGKKLFYEKYFKKPYDLFVEYNYWPYWTVPELGSTLLTDLHSKNKLSPNELDFLNGFIDYKHQNKYLFFTDLLPIRITDSQKIKPFLIEKISEQDLSAFIIERINHLIDIFNPKIIFVNNAFVSDLLVKTNFKNENNFNTYKLINNQKTALVFSSIMSNGNLDKYSEYRLKNEIRNLLK